MPNELIILNDYCIQCNVEDSFILLLEEEGLIHIIIQEGEKYLDSSELKQLERYSRLHYDLSINIEGIGAIHHLLERIEKLQKELNQLRG